MVDNHRGQRRYPGASREKERNVPIARSHVLNLWRAGPLAFAGFRFAGGIITGILIDLDHIPLFIFGISWIPVPVNTIHFSPARLLHSALFLVSCCVFACAGGLLSRLVLKDLSVALSAKPAAGALKPGKGSTDIVPDDAPSASNDDISQSDYDAKKARGPANK